MWLLQVPTMLEPGHHSDSCPLNGCQGARSRACDRVLNDESHTLVNQSHQYR
jgi:hypothetical protein